MAVVECVFMILVTLLFFLCGLVTASVFFKLAMDWPRIMQQWSEIDRAMSSYGFPKGLKNKLKAFTATIMTAAISEFTKFKHSLQT